MRNITLLLVFFFLFSCSSNDDNNRYKLLRSVVDVFDDGSSATTLFNYVGNKIERIDEVDKSRMFTYTDDLITQIIILDKKTQIQDTLKYIYANDQLAQIISLENYVINYTHKSDGSVSYEKIQKDSGNHVISQLSGILYFQNDNLTKDERTFSDPNFDPGSNVQITESEEFEYDGKINPLHNVLGFDKLLDYLNLVSSNNSKHFWKFSDVSYIGEDKGLSSSAYFGTNYKYDSDGYPTEVESARSFLGSGNSNNTKTFFNYK